MPPAAEGFHMNDLDWKQPAIIGGLIVGILSATPGLQLLNCCLCAWPVIGGLVATKMVISRSPRAVKTGEGAQIGLMAGLVGGGIMLVIATLLILTGINEIIVKGMLTFLSQISQDEKSQEAIAQVLTATQNQSMGQKLVGGLIGNIVMIVIYVSFTVLGGLLGVALFEKRKDPGPPQPPVYPPFEPPQAGGGQGWPQQ